MGKFYQKYFQPRTDLSERELKKGRSLFVVDALLGSWIATAVGGTYLAGFLDMLGAPEALSGIVLTIPTFAALVQLLTPYTLKLVNNQKLLCVLEMGISRLLLILTLFLPMCFGISKAVLAVCCVFVVMGTLLSSLAEPISSLRFVCFVPLKIRGEYCGKKDALDYVSIAIAGYVIGIVLDYFKVVNALRMGFFVVGIVIFVIWIFDTWCCMEVAAANSEERMDNINLVSLWKRSFGTRQFRKLIGSCFLQNCISYIAVAYVSIYVISTLHVSYATISLLTLISVAIKAFCAPLWGKLANRTSFNFSLMVSTLGVVISLVCWAFTVPANASWMYPVSMVLLCAAQAGTGLSFFGYRLDMAPPGEQGLYIAFASAVSGVISFVLSIAVSVFVAASENLRISLGFMEIGNIQILFLVSVVIGVFYCFYLAKSEKNT